MYILDDNWYDADKTPHEEKCRGNDATTESEDDGFGDLDLGMNGGRRRDERDE